MTENKENRLFLLDAYALIFRSYFAFVKNPRINSKGQNTSAIFGFANTLLDILQKENPTHLGVVFDPPGGSTIRNEQYAAYKAHRPETPEDIIRSVPYIKRFIEAMNIPVLMLDGYEADDVIGTISTQAAKQHFNVYIVTSDKDMGQLVNHNIFVYKPPAYGNPAQILDSAAFCDKFQISKPELIIDLLGLMGDSADNIPGIPGVGEKTAQKLLAEYGSFDSVLDHSDQIKGKLGEKIRENANLGRLSKVLATIIIDAPISFNASDLKVDPPNREKITELFSELEFRSLLQRVLGDSSQVKMVQGSQMSLFGAEPMVESIQISDFKTIDNTPHKYQTIDQIEAFLSLLLQQNDVCFDTETTGLDSINAQLVGISFSWIASEAYYLPISDEKDAQIKLNQLKPFFESEHIRKSGQNLKYDLNVLRRYQVEVKGTLFDTMIAHYLLNPEKKHGMDYLSETYLGYRPVSIEQLIGKKGKNQLNMRDVALDNILEYACEDADITLQLREVFAPVLASKEMHQLATEVEMPLIDVLSAMECEGINIDCAALKQYSKVLEQELILLHDSIMQHAGVPFNPDSPKQLGEILFEHLKIDLGAKRTKTGQYATGEEILITLRDKHPIVNDLLEYRGLRKLKSTYVDTLPEMVNKATGRIHTTFLQTVAATGRLSSNHPNLQNIPIKTEKGREIRKSFVPRNNDHLILSADYSQIELRIIAALSNDIGMIEAFARGEDIHAATAAKVFGVPLNEVTKEMRSKAKAVNFGIIYGQSAFGLSQNLGISRTEAKEIIDNYFEMFSGVKTYISDAAKKAKETGYVETLLKRRRYLSDINSSNPVVRNQAERNAINAPIQGSAADIIKIAMVNIHRELKEKKLKTKMILQVHDELLFDLYKPEKEVVMDIVRDKMEHAVKLSVPLTVEMAAAENWLDAH